MEKIVLKNFKCFEYEEIELDSLTILTGINGSGKSTVIQALLLLLQIENNENPYSKLSKDRNSNEIILNGYYYECGIAKNILYSNAQNDMITFSIYSGKKYQSDFQFIINEKNSRILPFTFTLFKNGIQMTQEKIIEEQATNMKHNFFMYQDFDFISADRFGPRIRYEISSESQKVGKYGEFLPQFIAEHKENIIEDENLYFKKDGKKHSLLTEINNWLSHIIEGAQINADIISEAHVSLLKMTNYSKVELDYMSPLNMPYGASYVLPIIAACLLKDKDSLTIIENPESHLHPAAQSKLGQFFAQIAATGRQIIIETHSDHIINGIRIAVKKEKISPERVIFNNFSKGIHIGENTVTPISPDKNGKLPDWPEGFFDQYEKDMMELV